MNRSEATAAGFSERRLVADSIAIRCLEAGTGPPLVYLHGGGGLHVSAGLERLARSFRVVALELPGFGVTPACPRGESYDGFAATIAAVLEALGLVRCPLLGTSLGGTVALHVALHAPGRVSTLVLESPAALRPDDWTPPDPATLTERLYLHPERAPAPLDPATAARQGALIRRLAATCDQERLTRRLAGLRTPTLVLFGVADGLIPPRMGRVYRDGAPNCSFVLVQDAAHEIGSDRPAAYAELVTRFVRDGGIATVAGTTIERQETDV